MDGIILDAMAVARSCILSVKKGLVTIFVKKNSLLRMKRSTLRCLSDLRPHTRLPAANG